MSFVKEKIATLLQWFSVTSFIESFKLWVESEKELYNEETIYDEGAKMGSIKT